MRLVAPQQFLWNVYHAQFFLAYYGTIYRGSNLNTRMGLQQKNHRTPSGRFRVFPKSFLGLQKNVSSFCNPSNGHGQGIPFVPYLIDQNCQDHMQR
jgi:hypothetical protein